MRYQQTLATSPHSLLDFDMGYQIKAMRKYSQGLPTKLSAWVTLSMSNVLPRVLHFGKVSSVPFP